MKQVILGTAGHIDHGKTSLIKALTGINTDRLKAEQSRGITIELGFASFNLPNGHNLGVIDVPGHEKFIKNMVAGATGIDILAMVIAADEGVMPQTREHMEICSLLDIKCGLIVLTKIDTVDSEWIELVKEDISDFVDNTFLKNAPIIPVSSLTGKGIKTLTRKIMELYNRIPPRFSLDIFRLPVDRVFTMKGFGTVVTGTIISGEVKINTPVMIYPKQIESKVRGIQVHNKSVTEAKVGMRAAINFQGLVKDEVNRGDIISLSNTLTTSYMVDVFLKFLNSNIKPIKNRVKIRFHAGTSEIIGRVILMDRSALLPGENCFAQIRLESPIAIVKDDRFIIRSYSPMRTIGGGRILNPVPKKQKRFQDETIAGFKILETGDSSEIVQHHVKLAGIYGISFDELIVATRISSKKLNSKIALALSKKKIIKIDKNNHIYVHIYTIKLINKYVENILEKYHKKNPIRMGIPKEEIKSQLPFNISHKLFTHSIEHMVKTNKIIIQNESVKLAKHIVELEIDQKIIKNKIVNIYKKSQLTPPYFRDVIGKIGISAKKANPVLELLIKEKILIKVKEELFYHKNVIETIYQKLNDFLVNNGEITTSQFKAMIKTSRKYAIPLIEYFDTIKITIRIDNIRRLR